MANNPHVDLSGDIRDFRRALSWTLTHKLYELEKETGRIEQIIKDRPKEPAPASESPTPQAHESTSSIDGPIVGHIDLRQFDPTKAKRRERIKGGSSIPAPSIYLSSKEAAEVFPERKALVESFLKLAAEDADYVRDCFLLRSTLQYAVIRKEITDLNCDYYVIRSYTGKLPSSNEIAAFLVDAYTSEENLTRDLLTTLAKRYGVFSLLDAVCDNPFLRGKNPDLTQAKKAISEAIAGLGGGQMNFRKDMNAIMIALDNHVLRDLGSYILAAKKITKSDLSRKEFPLNEDQIEMYQFGQLEFSTYPEGKDEYLKALIGALHEAEEKGRISLSERCAVNGEVAPVVEPTKGEDPAKPKFETKAGGDTVNNIHIEISATHIEQTTAIQNNQQINNIFNPSATDQASPEEEAPTVTPDKISSQHLSEHGIETPTAPMETEPVTPSASPAIEVSTEESRTIPKSYRVTRPPRFKGDLGERAFRRLFDLMKDVYFECDSSENFTGLFRCPPDEEIEFYTMIDWIHDDGITGLQCFIEALYRSDEYAIAPAIPKGKLSSIFLVNGVRKKLSNNPLYCWGKDKHIINDKDQEKRIRKYLELIDESFREPKDRQ